MSVPNISSVWRSFFDLYAKTAKQNKFDSEANAEADDFLVKI